MSKLKKAELPKLNGNPAFFNLHLIEIFRFQGHFSHNRASYCQSNTFHWYE
jgi:hypothetical protein